MDSDTILTSSPSWWSVYKDGNVEAAEAFLQWLTTDEAQEVLVKEAGFVSPFKSCTIVGDDPFAQTITDYQKRRKDIRMALVRFQVSKKVSHRTIQVRYLLTMHLEALMKLDL